MSDDTHLLSSAITIADGFFLLASLSPVDMESDKKNRPLMNSVVVIFLCFGFIVALNGM